jgi:hypothetical protein
VRPARTWRGSRTGSGSRPRPSREHPG